MSKQIHEIVENVCIAEMPIVYATMLVDIKYCIFKDDTSVFIEQRLVWNIFHYIWVSLNFNSIMVMFLLNVFITVLSILVIWKQLEAMNKR